MSLDTSRDRAPLGTVYLELSEGQSRKFYEVTVNGSELVLRYGRIGSSGQSSSTTYSTTEQAQAEALKKINEKLRKGYTRISAEDHLSTSSLQSVSNAPPVATATGVHSRAIDLATLPMAMDSELSVLRIPLARSLSAIEIVATCVPSNVLLNSLNRPHPLHPLFMLNLDALNDIAYHLGIRFFQGQAIQNAQVTGGWGVEENLPIPPEFVSGQPFTLRIALEQTLVIYLNGRVFSRFAHRLPPAQIDALRVLCPPGNLQVQSVQVSDQSGPRPSPADSPAAVQVEVGPVPPFLQMLPTQFEPLRPFLETNLVPYIKIHAGASVGSLDPVEDASGDPLTVWQSKIGGNPYFPKAMEYPIDPDSDTAMALLLQINCADVPPIAGFDFPRQGMLQFYLGSEPADADSTPGKYRVLYFPEISTNENDLITDFSFLGEDNGIRDSYPEVYPIAFAVGQDVFWEWRHLETTGLAPDVAELCGACHGWLWSYMDETCTGKRGSKLGGYPDLHSNMDEIAKSANGRLFLELVHPSCGDDSFLFFIPDEHLSRCVFSDVEFRFVCD
jgi:uncharacterized protein YwqG/predicted DNA-binding WGR domain protein